MSRPRQIVAMGGGGFSMEPDNPLLDDFVLALAGTDTPAICLLPTAAGDSDRLLDAFYAGFPPSRARAMHLSLFNRQRGGLRKRLLANDVVYIGGGNTANLLAIWRQHRMDDLVREAWEAGVVLGGVSAGACCLFEACLTDSFGPPLVPLRDGLALLGGSFCPHYDHRARRPQYRQLVGKELPAGVAADDGAGLHFEDGRLVEAVSSRPDGSAWRVGPDGEHRIPTRYLGRE